MNKRPVYYMQTDTRWRNKPYRVPGESSTIGGSGCGPTCAAMVIETLTGKKFDPVDACKWAVDHGYKALGQGTYYSYFVPQFEAFGIECVRMNWSSLYGKPDNVTHTRISQALKEGWYVIACMGPGTWTRSGHFVLLWWEDNKVHINDPASKATARTLGNVSTFRNEVKYYWAIDARKYNQEVPKEPEKKEGDDVKYYETLDEIPETFRPTVEKLVKAGYLKGRPTGLHLSDDMLRIFTIMDRAGAFD